MSLWRHVTRGIRGLAGPESADRDLADEVRHFFEEAAIDREASGLSPETARRAVRLELGNTRAIEEEIRSARWEDLVTRFVDTARQGVRFGLRPVRRAPVVAAAVLATLAIGIGATTAIFAIVTGVVVRPLPYPDADRLISLSHSAPGAHMDDVGSAPFLYFVERDARQTFDSVGLWNLDTATVTGLGMPEQVQRLSVTHEILPMLRIAPLHGRMFSDEDDAPDAAPTVVLTYSYWEHRFSRDLKAIGQTVTIDGQRHTILGVMPASFRFLDRDADAIVPYVLRRSEVLVGNYFRPSIGRLRPGVTLDEASVAVSQLIPTAFAGFPLRPGVSLEQALSTGLRPNLSPLKADIVGNAGTTLWVLMATVTVVLLIACANVTSLLLVQVEDRRRELGLRAALGAGSRRLTGELVTESLLLSVAAWTAGVGVAYSIVDLVTRFAPTDLPRVREITIDSTVLLFAGALSVAAVLLVSLVPVLRHCSLRAGSLSPCRSCGPHDRFTIRGPLISVQVALALVLLTSGGLMLRTFMQLSRAETGFREANRLQTARIEIPAATVPQPDSIVRLEKHVTERLASLPGVTAVAFASSLPMDGTSAADMIVPEDAPSGGAARRLRQFRSVSPGWFAAMGTPIVAGRDLTWRDAFEMRPVVLVSEHLAQELWTDATRAVGKRLRTSSAADAWREVVGVVGDVHDRGVSRPVTELVYLPVAAQRIFNQPRTVTTSLVYVLRSDRTGTPGLIADVRQAVWNVDSSLPVANALAMSDVVKQSFARTRFTLIMLLLAGAMAVLLGLVGIYAVIAYTVSRQVREVGVRLAFGAEGPAIRRLFIKRGLTLTAVGIVIGLVVAGLLTRGMSTLLFEVRPLDPITYVIVTLGLLCASALAVYLPATRATQIDPVVALRADQG